MKSSGDSSSVPAISPPRSRRRRWLFLLLAITLIGGGWATCEGWAAWQERLAVQALADNHLEDAKLHVDRALFIRRRRVSTLLLAARIRRVTAAYSEAEQLLLRCGELQGMSEPLQLEWLLLRCQMGEVDEVSPTLLALVRNKHPDSPAILEAIARVYLRQTRYLEALGCLNQLLEQTPDSVRALDWRGWVGVQLDHRDQAILDYERLLELQPNRSDIRLRLAQLLVESNHWSEAGPHLERLLVELPDNPELIAALAPYRVVQTRHEEARELLDAALQKHPDHFDLLFQRGKLELTLGNPAEAETWLRKALAAKPHDGEARYSLYQSLQRQPDHEREAEREHAIWEEEGKVQKRLTSLLRSELAAHPNDVKLACEAGELFLKLDEVDRGLFWLERAKGIDPNHIPTRRALLAYYEQTKNTDKAQEQRKILAQLGAAP
jgi:tetratricopeptide (TPR) repeat protein